MATCRFELFRVATDLALRNKIIYVATMQSSKMQHQYRSNKLTLHEFDRTQNRVPEGLPETKVLLNTFSDQFSYEGEVGRWVGHTRMF